MIKLRVSEIVHKLYESRLVETIAILFIQLRIRANGAVL
jgi:hypothetical protein